MPHIGGHGICHGSNPSAGYAPACPVALCGAAVARGGKRPARQRGFEGGSALCFFFAGRECHAVSMTSGGGVSPIPFLGGCNGGAGEHPLAKVGIGRQKATRKSGFCTSMHTLSSAQGAGAVLKFFCAGFCGDMPRHSNGFGRSLRYKSNSGFNLLRQGAETGMRGRSLYTGSS